MHAAPPSRFITIPFSHYCEKARWALDRAGHAYVEEPHAPGFHRPVTRRLGAHGSVPVLVTSEGRVVDDSTAILQHVGAAAELFPHESPLRSEVLDLEERFDVALGPHLRRKMYFHALADRSVAVPVLCKGVPRWEGALINLLFPALRRVMRQSMRIDAESATRSERVVRTVFAEVNERLNDGRKWLVGDRFSAADLTFAALAAPAILPRQYAARVPNEELLPRDLLPFLEELRESPAGRFVQRVYEEERGRVMSRG